MEATTAPPGIRALSIRQPWAWLIGQGLKDIENRTWQTKFRGPLAIHAGLALDRDFSATGGGSFPLPYDGPMPLAHEFERGGIVAVARVVDCVSVTESP